MTLPKTRLSGSCASTAASASRRRFQAGDVELHHLEHRFGDALGLALVGIVHEFPQQPWRDLPGEAPAVLQPAALLCRAALLQRLPQAVDLSLGFAFDHDREAVVER